MGGAGCVGVGVGWDVEPPNGHQSISCPKCLFFNSYPPYPRCYETLSSTCKESCQESWPLVPRPMFAANIPLRGKCLVTRRRSQHFFYSLEQTGDTLNSWASQLLLSARSKTFDISMPLWKWFTPQRLALVCCDYKYTMTPLSSIYDDWNRRILNLWTHKHCFIQLSFKQYTSKHRMNCLCRI